MKNKLISVAVFCGFTYLIPLVGRYSLIGSVQIVVLLGFASILLCTQPALSIDESKEQKNKDHYSVWLIVWGCCFCQVFSVVEWAYFDTPSPVSKYSATAIIGLCCMIGGTVFRIWAIKTLGSFFTSTVQTQQNHQIITHSVYRFLRHPSYLGAYLTLIGASLWLEAYTGAMFSALLMFGIYLFRMKVEEAVLLQKFGELYRNYQQKTYRIIPFVY